MNNYDSPGESVEFTAPTGGVTTGLGVKIGSLIVIATVTALATEKFSAFVGPGVCYVLKVTTEVWTEGLKIYWDDTAKLFTSTAAANLLVGVATKATVSPSTKGYVRLDGVAR